MLSSPKKSRKNAMLKMGYEAVQLLMNNIGNRVVAMKNDKIVNYDIYEALTMKKEVDTTLYKLAHEISI